MVERFICDLVLWGSFWNKDIEVFGIVHFYYKNLIIIKIEIFWTICLSFFRNHIKLNGLKLDHKFIF